jgi:hypothetical protein
VAFGGEHAWLFDNEVDGLDLDAPTIGFDMTAILDQPALRSPTMLYLFHRVEERLDGKPTIIVVDEGWKALDDEVFVARIRDWEKTIRKRGGIVGFATQSASDALESKIASAIIEQAGTQIFMANSQAQASDYIDGFGLTAHEYELVRSIPETARAFLVKHGADSVVVRLNLRSEPDLLTVLSGRERPCACLTRCAAKSAIGCPVSWKRHEPGSVRPCGDSRPGRRTARQHRLPGVKPRRARLFRVVDPGGCHRNAPDEPDGDRGSILRLSASAWEGARTPGRDGPRHPAWRCHSARSLLVVIPYASL